MAASSSSALVPSISSSQYQVFLSFRGKDTRKGFTGHLYKALKDAGVHTFMDDEEIEVGEKFGERLLKAIDESRYYVVILSKGYADSKWCLKELAAMVVMESTSRPSQHRKEIIPVFYYVEPSDVRHQRGPFEQSFKDHEVLYNPTNVEEWRQAMTKIGEHQGPVIKDESSKKEAELIEEIVKKVGGRSDNGMLHVAKHPVGIDARFEEVMELLNIGEGGVKMVGIYGMRGVGKTTLAKEIYNRLQDRFDKAIYIEGIKDAVKKDGLPKLQEQFISKAFKHGNLDIYNSSEGISKISKRFCRTRLLAILDDVDHRDQLNALVGGCDWFGEGTRILITTRDTHLLNAHGVDERYEVPQLNSRDSLRLFSWHAFNNEKPSEGYMEISQQVAEVAGGLPLALEVLGSSLIGKNNKRVWEQEVTKLRGLSHVDIYRCLRISYDGLNQEEQKIFLDVACFFIYEEKGRVIDTLRGCRFKFPESSIDVLLQKCLLKVDDRGKLRMHDLLRDMGRNIGSRTRLWDQQQVWDVLNGHTGTPEIEGIVCQKIPEREEEGLDVEAFTNMSKLRLLLLENIHLKGDFSKMPTSLRSLRWKHCPMKVLPDNFNIQKIGFLDLSMGNIIQVWSDSYMSKKKVFPNLKLLDLSECKGLVKLPDFSCSLKLEKLYLQNCCKLVSIPDSICLLKNLVYLNISGCQLIKDMPNEIGKLEKLIELYLHGTKIDALPYSVRSLQKLEVLSLNGCEKLKMPAPGEVKAELLDFVVNLESLRELSLWQYMLEKIPDQSVGKLTNLEKLKVGGALRELPNTILNLNKLCELDLSCSSIEELPESIGFLQNMKTLRLQDCKMLKCLPESIGSLTRLEELTLTRCYTLRELPSSIGHLSKLKGLFLECVPIAELPNSIELLESLILLDIVYCDKLETVLPLWELNSLQRLRVGSGSEVDGQQVGNLVEMSGKSPHSEECRMIEYYTSTNVEDIWHLSVTVGDQKRVIVLFDANFLGPNNRPWLSLIFPNDFVDFQYKYEDWSPNQGGTFNTGILNLHCIHVIDLSYSDMEELDESIVHLPNLKQLNLRHCKKLKCLPTSFGCLTRLRFLSLWGCESLTALPESIGGMKSLHFLALGFSGIKELPNTIKFLSSLEFLNINQGVKLRGGVPLCDLEELRRLEFEVGYEEEGEETNEEVPDDMVEMSGYSEQLQQFRRIRFIGCEDDIPNHELVLRNKWELSIRMGDEQKRVIRVLEQVYIEGLKKWQWLKLIFPEDFHRKQSVAVWPFLSKQLGQCLDPHNCILGVPSVLTLCGIDTQSLPDAIGCLQGLRILRLRECKQLTCLPESIGYLIQLRALDLDGCTSLSTLPNSIENLTRLKVLRLAACSSLKLLPNSIGNLKRLWCLDLSYSGIEVLPHSFPLLESLKRLGIIGCYRLQGRLPLWEMKCLKKLAVGNEIGEKDVGEILDGITRYSQQAKEYRRIHHNNIQDGKLELSIWVEGGQEREIELRLYRPCEGRKGQSWLRHIFPKDFTPQYETRARSEASASHSSLKGSHLTNIEKLKVGGALRELPNTSLNLNKQCELDLSGSNIELLPESIGFMQNLKTLRLLECKMLKCLPESIGSLTRLEELNLTGCITLRELPSSIGHLSKLKMLLLECVPIAELPKSIQLLESLTFLDIAFCNKLETVLPLWELKSLEDLRVGSRFEFDGQQVGNLVEMSGKSPHSQECRMIEYYTSTNVEDLWKLSVFVADQKRRIRLADRNMQGCNNRRWLSLIFPNDFVDVQEKCEDWSPNLGGTLSTGVPKLHCIRAIDLSNSDMEELDESIVHLPHLRQLNLRHCKKLKCLPISFGCLTLLRYLNLWGCESLSTLPNSIGKLTMLGYLNLCGCQSLSTLPNSIGNLTRLEQLLLGDCTSLKLLPNSIGNLKRLWWFNLSHSGIKVLPQSFPLLESLEHLIIVGCYRLQGRLPLWEMKCLHALAVGDEVGEKDVGEIPDGITHYSQQAKEYRRIKHSNIQEEQHWVKLELSIWVEGSQEREIELNVFPPCEGRKGQSWLRHIFPDDFTPQYDTRARSEASASHSSPPDTSACQFKY